MPVKGTAIYLSLGSNLGDRKRNLNRAREAIRDQIGDPIKLSGVFHSEAWGYSSTHSFYNCCISVLTRLEPLVVLDALLSIEESMGRVREEGGYADRLIDMDLLFYGDRIMNHPRLILPHPDLDKRRFVLEPLAEIAPALVHPRSGLNITELLARCTDQSVLTPVKNA
jgi:2-amino-4-hydroxy-6-hydroxymethyldihydropteridine diphosphokinase